MARENFGPGGNLSSEDALFYATQGNTAFKNWMAKLQTSFKPEEIANVKILEVYPFGPARVAKGGFVIAQANVKKDNVAIPGFAFLRGGASAILPILITPDGQKYVVTTIQPRVPGAEREYEEIPAGMVDNTGTFAGTAAKEMQEETGLTVKESELTPLCEMYPSIGGCDEKIAMYVWQANIEAKDLEALQGLATGALEENEVIHLNVRTLEDFTEACLTSKITDAKAQNALGLYTMLLAKGVDMKGQAFKPVASVPAGTVHMKSLKNSGLANIQTAGRRKNKKQNKKTQKKNNKKNNKRNNKSRKH